MLKINLISLLISALLAILTIVVLESLVLAITTIIISLMIRGVLAEIFLSRIINISVYKDIFLELAMTGIFIITGWYLASWLALILYLITYGVYLILKRKDIRDTLFTMKVWMKA